HFIVERNAGFFVRRFTGMRWSILTSKGSVHWDGEELALAPPASRRDVAPEDGSEELWRTYFQNTFNPARLKVKAMQAEMPKKYWRNLPEASLIKPLIAGAGRAAGDMIAHGATEPHKAQKRPEPMKRKHSVSGDNIEALREEAAGCRA